jgi:hypothetical protein
MTYFEIMRTAKNLPYEQRLSLIETLIQSLRDERSHTAQQTSTLSQVRGILKVDDMLHTDQVFEDDYTDYLIEKYS